MPIYFTKGQASKEILKAYVKCTKKVSRNTDTNLYKIKHRYSLSIQIKLLRSVDALGLLCFKSIEKG